MRAALALVAILLVAGCTKEDEPAQTSAIMPGTIVGTVTDVALTPLESVEVRVDGTNVSARTDAAGAFTIEIIPGEYVVIAEHVDHKPGALRASVISAQVASLAFQLDAIPRIVPRIDVAEGAGYLACAAVALTSGDRHAVPCGEGDPNDRESVEFPLVSLDGLEGALIEVAWEPRTQAATRLRVEIGLRSGGEVAAIGATEGPSPIAVAVPARLLDEGDLVVRVGVAGSFADEEAGNDLGIVLQQPFQVYASTFFHEGAPVGYSALGDA